MIAKVLLTAAAAGMVSTAAFAQVQNNNPATQEPETSAQSPNTVNPAPQDRTANRPQASDAVIAPTGEARDVVFISAEEARSRGIEVETVTNGPVPDTAENRARFGGPQSRAGKATRPAGN